MISNGRHECKVTLFISSLHGGGRVRMNQIKGNWRFICKHWREMRLNELFRALTILLKRAVLHLARR